MKLSARFSIVLATSLACASCHGSGGTLPSTFGATRVAPNGLLDTNLYVASSGGKTSSGAVTIYGLERGKLLATITDGVDKPSAIGYDAPANLIAVASTQPGHGGKSGSISLFAPGATKPASVLKGTSDPVSLAFDNTGDVYVANFLGGVGIYKPGRVRPVRTIPRLYWGSEQGVYQPRLLALDPKGNLYVADGPKPIGSEERIYVLSVFPPGQSESQGAVGIGPPRALLVTENVVYIACAFSKNDKKNPDGWVRAYPLRLGFPSLEIKEGIHTPDALAVDASGNLYVANLNGQSVTVYHAGETSPFRTITQGVHFPKALAIGPMGTLYVSNLYDNTVTVYKPGQAAPSLTIKQSIDAPVALTLNASPQ